MYILGVKNFVEMAVSRTVSEINAFYAEIQYGRQKWWENHFLQKVADNSTHTLRVKNFVQVALSHTVSEINRFMHFHHCQIQKIAITHLAIEVHL